MEYSASSPAGRVVAGTQVNAGLLLRLNFVGHSIVLEMFGGISRDLRAGPIRLLGFEVRRELRGLRVRNRGL